MNPDHLVELAEQTAQFGGGRPRQATLNRAISTAYYALFHALANECVARTVGSVRSPRYWEIVGPMYRAMDHGGARTVLRRLAETSGSPNGLRRIARSFLELQEARITADYDPSKRFSRREALDLIGQARRAVEALRGVPEEDRLLLVVQLITKPR